MRVFIERTNAADTGRVLEFALDDPSSSARRLERLVRWRNRLFGLPYGDQGLLISKRLYGRIGGYRDFSLMEDVDIVRRLGRESLRAIDFRATTSAVRFQQDGYWVRPMRNLACLALFYIGVPVGRDQAGLRMRRRHLIIFAKPPRLGRVKRRLAADIGIMEALRFYRRNLAATLRMLGRDPRWQCWLFLDRGRSLAPQPAAAFASARRPWCAHGNGASRSAARLNRTDRIGYSRCVSKRYSPCLSWFGAVRRCFWAGGGRWLLACRPC